MLWDVKMVKKSLRRFKDDDDVVNGDYCNNKIKQYKLKISWSDKIKKESMRRIILLKKYKVHKQRDRKLSES